MGEPAELSRTEQTQTHRLADRIYEGTDEDTGEPLDVLDAYANELDVPRETLVLWLAQEVRRLRVPAEHFGDDDRRLAAQTVRDLQDKIREQNARIVELELQANPRPGRFAATMEDPAPVATPEVPGYMHEYQPAPAKPRAAGEVLPPDQRATWARTKVPGIDK